MQKDIRTFGRNYNQNIGKTTFKLRNSRFIFTVKLHLTRLVQI